MKPALCRSWALSQGKNVVEGNFKKDQHLIEFFLWMFILLKLDMTIRPMCRRIQKVFFSGMIRQTRNYGDDTMKKIKVFLALAMFFILVSARPGLCGQSYHHKGGNTALKAHFSALDTDGDDTLSFVEFKTAFPSAEQKAFDFLDGDKDGMLNHDEWRTFKEMHQGMGMHDKKNYHAEGLPDPSGFNAHFPDMDSDKNDLVSPTEFNAYFPDASEKTKAFNAIDLDGSGTLDHGEWHEFKKAHSMKKSD